MRAELVECWLCEETIAPEGARIRCRDKRGRVHPWADRRGRWQPEYICRACALVYPDCIPGYAGRARPSDQRGGIVLLRK
jgi:hypothetical protein